MSELKCPFCQQKLVRHWGMKEPPLYCCDNPKCSRGGVATESAWQELMRTRKALDVAKDAIDAGKTLADIAGFKMLVAGLEEALEQITALEQKE